MPLQESETPASDGADHVVDTTNEEQVVACKANQLLVSIDFWCK